MAKTFSICIPTASIKNEVGDDKKGVLMLENLLNTIDKQTFKDFEVVISDHSTTNNIKNILPNWSHLNIKYFKNNEGIGSAVINLNNAISKSEGKIIKTIFQDDFFYDDNTLKYINDNLGHYKFGFVGSKNCEEDDITKVTETLSPHWISADNILRGINTVGGPTTMFFNNDNNYLDVNLCWLNDTEFYYRLYKKYGNPLCLPNQCVVQRTRAGGLSNTIPESIRNEEHHYVVEKHNNGFTNLKNYPNILDRINNLK